MQQQQIQPIRLSYNQSIKQPLHMALNPRKHAIRECRRRRGFITLFSQKIHLHMLPSSYVIPDTSRRLTRTGVSASGLFFPRARPNERFTGIWYVVLCAACVFGARASRCFFDYIYWRLDGLASIVFFCNVEGFVRNILMAIARI